MSGPGAAADRLLARLLAAPEARLVRAGEAWILSGTGAGRKPKIDEAAVRRLVADGLLASAGPGLLAATAEARARRDRLAGGGFAAQHGETGSARIDDGTGLVAVRVNHAESPVALLARRRGGREAWLSPAEAEAAERVRRDFEKGGMQPRITANWDAAVNSGRRDGGGDIADAAIGARRRVEAAMAAIGPELCGVVLDACCFLKGLEAIEHERGWPARSAKLALKLGLAALARHYGLAETARGGERGRMRSWGGEGYRPVIV